MTTAATSQRTVLERFTAGQCAQGTDAQVVREFGSDQFHVVTNNTTK